MSHSKSIVLFNTPLPKAKQKIPNSTITNHKSGILLEDVLVYYFVLRGKADAEILVF